MAGSTLPQRAMGRMLLDLRTRSGMTQGAAARTIEFSGQSVGRLEDGLPSKAGTLHLNALCDAYKADQEERKIILALYQEAKTAQKAGGSWWRTYSEVPAEFSHYLMLEDAATSLTTWQPAFLPGLLQTADYRREAAWAENPTWTHTEVERRVELAERRRDRLRDPDFRVEVLLSEAVLRQQVGGWSVMADQLHHLIELSQLANVTLRAVPFSARSPVGQIVGPFVLLEFPVLPTTRLQEPPVVYVEEYVGDLYLERQADVQQYRDALDLIRRVALDPIETMSLVTAIAKEFSE